MFEIIEHLIPFIIVFLGMFGGIALTILGKDNNHGQGGSCGGHKDCSA